MRPELYTHVDLFPDNTIELKPKTKQVIQAFSCGVDSSFTLVSNICMLKEQGGFDISAGLMCHGFDISYDNGHGFNQLVERAHAVLDEFGIKLFLMRTNSKTLKMQGWMDSATAQLAGCLHQFSGSYSTALMGSAHAYDEVEFPLGSNPVTDPLYSGDLMSVVHDGAGYSRTEKVEAIARFPVVTEHLKVCWIGESQHKNCGVCEKCVRTRVNFAAAGHDSPSCFPGPFDKSMLWKLLALTHSQVLELKSIVTYVKQYGVSYPWMFDLRRQIVLSRLAIIFRWQTMRKFLRRAFHRITSRRRRIPVTPQVESPPRIRRSKT